MKILGWVLLIAVSHTCFAEDYQKNGLPCVAELCIGDGIPELKKIQWETVKGAEDYSRDKDVKYFLNSVKSSYERKYIGDVSMRAISILVGRRFDNSALPLLAGILANCGEGDSLSGLYKTKSGRPTDVWIALRQKTSNSSEQQWTVVSIRRWFDAANPQDVKNAEMQLSERYKQFNVNDAIGRRKSPLPENGNFEFRTDSSGGFSFDLRDATPAIKPSQLPSQCIRKINLD